MALDPSSGLGFCRSLIITLPVSSLVPLILILGTCVYMSLNQRRRTKVFFRFLKGSLMQKRLRTSNLNFSIKSIKIKDFLSTYSQFFGIGHKALPGLGSSPTSNIILQVTCASPLCFPLQQNESVVSQKVSLKVC